MRIAGASVVGEGHASSGAPCQDACAWKVLPDGVVVVAVADGMGSAKRAEVGSRLAVDAAVACLTKEPDAELGRAFAAARDALLAQAVVDGAPTEDYATTLLVAVGRSDALRIGHLGDGAAIGELADGLRVLSAPEETEYVNETTPLTSRAWEGRLRVATHHGVCGLVLMTDGCQRASLTRKGGSHEPVPRFFLPLLRRLRESSDAEFQQDLEGLLRARKLADVSDDDKTLVVVDLLVPLEAVEDDVPKAV